jgi:hypothetical protein
VKLSIGKAWEETSAFLGKEARLVAPVALATFAFPAVLSGWAFPGGATGAMGWVMLLALIVALIGQMTIVLLANGWRGSIGEAMGRAVRRLPVLIGALLIVFLPLILIAIIAMTAVLSSAGITDPTTLTPQTLARVPNIGWIALLLTLFFIVAGVRLFPVAAIAANEPVGPIALLRRSWRLTSGSFWRLLALVLLLGVLTMVVSQAVTAVTGSVAALAVGEPRPFNLSALLIALATGLVGAIISTVSATMVGRVYAQLSVAPSVPPTA